MSEKKGISSFFTTNRYFSRNTFNRRIKVFRQMSEAAKKKPYFSAGQYPKIDRYKGQHRNNAHLRTDWRYLHFIYFTG